MSEPNPWITRDRRLVYENPWIRVHEDNVVRPDGKPGIYGVVHFKNKAVGVLAVESDGGVWLVGQHRYPLNQYSWEIPEGGCPEGELPETCAQRELAEETGLIAGSLEPLVTAHLSNSVSDEWGIVYRATQLTRGPSRPDGCERLQVRLVPFEQALEMVEAGEITDSLSVIALLHEGLQRQRRMRATTPRSMALTLLTASFAIVRLSPGAPFPEWAAESAMLSLTRTPDELSLVVEMSRVPAGEMADRGWKAFRIEGVLDLNEPGILASLSGTLAASGIPLFAISTYNTDYILVREADLTRANDSLRAAGHHVQSHAPTRAT